MNSLELGVIGDKILKQRTKKAEQRPLVKVNKKHAESVNVLVTVTENG